MKSKTKIGKQLKNKTNSYLVETVLAARKNKKWFDVACILSGPRYNYAEKNLFEIDKETKEGDLVVVPGKVLGNGEVSKKLRVIAFKFSKEAEEKLKSKKCDVVSIINEIKSNPEAKGIKVLR